MLAESHEADPDSLDALLIAALDGADQTRVDLLARLCLMNRDRDRAADLERYRVNGLPPVYLA